MSVPRIHVSESVSRGLIVSAMKSEPLETGGVLVGVYLDGEPWVTHMIEIASTQRGRTHYRIPRGVTRPAVQRFRATDPRLGYLGDWHSHPLDVGPSATDLASLALISLRQARYPNPTGLLVRRTVDGYQLEAHRIVNMTPRPCSIHYLGDLPPEEASQ